MEHRKNLFLGALLSLLSFFCLSSTNAMVKILDGRVNLFQILFLQNLFGFLVIILICLAMRKKMTFYKSKHYALLFLRSVAGLGGFFFVFIAVQYVSVADATLLLNTAPFFIPFMLLLYLKEAIDHRLWFGIIPGFIGIALILNPESSIFQWHAVLPLISGVCIAIIYISLRRLHLYHEPMIRILLYLFLFATLLMLPFGIYNWQIPSPSDWALLALISTTSFLSQTLITLSLRYGSPKALAPLCYSSVIFALLFDWLLWHHIPSWISFIGMVLVIVGGITALFIESQANKIKNQI